MKSATKTNYSQKIKKAFALLSLGIFLLNSIFVAPFFVHPAQAAFFEFGIKDEAELGLEIRNNANGLKWAEWPE